MNWIKQAYLNTADIAEQRSRTDNTIYFNFDAHTATENTRKLNFYSGAGKAVIRIGITATEANPAEIKLNNLPAGEFDALNIVLDVSLIEGVNTVSVTIRGADQGMLVSVTGNKLERIFEPLKIVGSTEFDEGCLLYSSEDGSLYRNLVSAKGEITREKIFGYITLDAKSFRSVSGVPLRFVSAGIDNESNLVYIDSGSSLLAQGISEAAVVEKYDGGVYILYRQDARLSLITVDEDGGYKYNYDILNGVEALFSAVSGSVFFYKSKGKWWSGEFVIYNNSRFDGCICLNDDLPEIGETFIKLTSLNTVNRPNASVENNNTVYYICREGNIYRFEDRKNDVVAYCEFYIPYKSGGVMIWSKKLCVFSRGIN